MLADKEKYRANKKGFGVTGYEIKHADFSNQAEIKLDIHCMGLKPNEVSDYLELLIETIQGLKMEADEPNLDAGNFKGNAEILLCAEGIVKEINKATSRRYLTRGMNNER